MIKRYDIIEPFNDMPDQIEEATNGFWVTYEDHEREVERYKKLCDSYENDWRTSKSELGTSRAKLAAEKRELERRLRWLESLIGGLECSFSDFYYDRSCCVFCGSIKGREHGVGCELFLSDGTPKPTPEDFK